MSNKTLELALTVLRRGTRIVYHEELEERKQAIKELEAMIEHQEPVAYITGFHNGHCVIQPTDPALVLPVGMALYRAPTKWVGLADAELIRQEEREACAKIAEQWPYEDERMFSIAQAIRARGEQ